MTARRPIDWERLAVAARARIADGDWRGFGHVKASGINLRHARDLMRGKAVPINSYLKLCRLLGRDPMSGDLLRGPQSTMLAATLTPGADIPPFWWPWFYLNVWGWLQKTGYSQREAAAAAGISLATMNRVAAPAKPEATAGGKNFSAETVIALCRAMGRHVHECCIDQNAGAVPPQIPEPVDVSRETSTETR